MKGNERRHSHRALSLLQLLLLLPLKSKKYNYIDIEVLTENDLYGLYLK